MVPYKPGLTKPEVVDKDACIGCGGCESICPERKMAVYVTRLETHETASKPKIRKQKKSRSWILAFNPWLFFAIKFSSNNSAEFFHGVGFLNIAGHTKRL